MNILMTKSFSIVFFFLINNSSKTDINIISHKTNVNQNPLCVSLFIIKFQNDDEKVKQYKVENDKNGKSNVIVRLDIVSIKPVLKWNTYPLRKKNKGI